MTRDDKNSKGILWLKLSDQSRDMLLERFTPRYADVYCDHITLAYGVQRHKVANLIGKTAQAEVVSLAYNEKVEAFRVLTGELPDTYGVPHITLSAQKGIEPFESVAMLKSEHQEAPIKPQTQISGVLEYVCLN